MYIIKKGIDALVVFCLLGAIVVSVAVGMVYNTYDCEYFSVEYPSNWDVKRSLAVEEEGLEYTFRGLDLGEVNPVAPFENASAHEICLTISADRIDLFMKLTLDAIENGSFDEPTQHFLDTLVFNSSNDNTSHDDQNITYLLYDGIYLSAEYPQGWMTDRKQDKTLGNVYLFGDSTTTLTFAFGTADKLNLDTVSMLMRVSRSSVVNGKFDEPVQHFMRTLCFKV
ncbi:hypothetical protein [Methanothrix harundinacea]|uniref:hypothetical protein n=1 Tax=Methanothrix harundinacea TaxID=301375 RepID=UPI00064FE182|nr:hypothetical protein [Methanothrix harundinacea]